MVAICEDSQEDADRIVDRSILAGTPVGCCGTILSSLRHALTSYKPGLAYLSP
jgi:hypothetical protein